MTNKAAGVVLRRKLILFVIIGLSVAHGTRAAPSFHGIYVVVDPYRTADLTFLTCAAGHAPPAGQRCLVSPTSNPFLLPAGSTTPAATGILLRLPWCAFQTDRQPHYSSTAQGSCHYRVRDAPSSIGYYYAGQFSDAGRTLQISANPAQQVDQYIGYLSTCSGQYDECDAGVFSTALSAVAAINKTTPLSLGVGLVTGLYTPISVMRHVGTIDLPILDTVSTNFCDRQPLAWRPEFVKAYTTALGRLVSDIQGYAGMPSIKVLKVSATAEASLEFNVDARPANFPTQTDPSGTAGTGIDGDAVLVCPDHLTPRPDGSLQTGVDVLLRAYTNYPVGSGTMADAYEGALGSATGYEAGLLANGAILSIATTGQQEFAHAACNAILDGLPLGQVLDQPLLGAPCMADPSPGVANYNWSEFYFMRFVEDLFLPGSIAYLRASAAYRGFGLYGLTRQQLAVMFTALQPPLLSPLPLSSLPACWLNNTSAKAPFVQNLPLYATPTSSDLVSVPGPVLATPGTLLAWQTQPLLTATAGYGDTCTTTTQQASYGAGLTMGVQNGGKFIEVETDAASESSCWSALASAVALLVPDNKTSLHCIY